MIIESFGFIITIKKKRMLASYRCSVTWGAARKIAHKKRGWGELGAGKRENISEVITTLVQSGNPTETAIKQTQ